MDKCYNKTTNIDIQDRLLTLGISENELKYKLRGAYNTSYFHMYIEGKFNVDLSQISQEDRGTFIHEYIHYWQNIGTLWGLSHSILMYDIMLKIREEITSLDEIKLPYMMTFTEELERRKCLFEVGNGFCQDGQYNDIKIDDSKRIKIITNYRIVCEKRFPIILLEITFQNNSTNIIELGAHIIKESMAALYQSLVDSKASHDDIPYNVVKILCKYNYPSLYENTKLLICCCYAALFSMTPGETLIMLLAKAEKERISDGMQLFSEYIDNSVIQTVKIKNIPIPDFFDGIVNKFLCKLSDNLVAPLDYIKEVLMRVRLSNRTIPLLTVLYEEKENIISVENLNAIVGWMGIPYIQTESNGHHNPATTAKQAKDIVEGDDSIDILELMALEAMYMFLTGKAPYRCCPLYGMMCRKTSFDKPECFDTPWLGAKCAFTAVSDPLRLKEKNVHW